MSWYGLWAPSGTPREVVARINADVQKVLRRGLPSKFGSPLLLDHRFPDEFAAFIKVEAGK